MFFFNWNDQKKATPVPADTSSAATTTTTVTAPAVSDTPSTDITSQSGYVSPKWQVPVQPTSSPMPAQMAMPQSQPQSTFETDKWDLVFDDEAEKPAAGVPSSPMQSATVPEKAQDFMQLDQSTDTTNPAAVTMQPQVGEDMQIGDDMSDYVDAYVPPQHLKHTPWTEETTLNDIQSSVDMSSAATSSQSTPTVPQPTSLDTFEKTESSSDLDDSDQSLEAQNIFQLLGVEDGEESEKEKFLDELQQVVWDDFVENDAVLLLTEQEHIEFTKIIDKKDIPAEQIQEEALVYLEKLIPDLEEVLLEKALGLKRDMVMERVSGMKEFYAAKPESLQVIAQAESLFSQDKWLDGANMLNTLK